MFIDEFICSCTRYIAQRRCADGGYCFYRLNEPNPADTFFALDALRLLGTVPDDPDTICWLLERQGEDGRYHSPESGYYVLLSLAALGVRPEHDPLPWLFSVFPSPRSAGTRPVESTSLLTRPYFFVRLCQALGVHPSPAVRTALLDAVGACRCPDGGYGDGRPTLVETYHALAISAYFGTVPPGAGSFLARCVHPVYGYLNVPGTVPAYLEHVAAGVGAARLLGVPPAEGAARCVHRCLRASGGAARSVFGGAATLEYTWYAVRAFDVPVRRSGPD